MPFRFYLTKEDLPDSPIKSDAIQKIRIIAHGESNNDNTTTINKIDHSKETKLAHDLNGRHVNKISKKGIYIINGKKFLLK
jgi:hypothetical protein